MDYSVLLFHGRDHIQKYLLTLMNIVSGNTDSQLRDKVNHREDTVERSPGKPVLSRTSLIKDVSTSLFTRGHSCSTWEGVDGFSYLKWKNNRKYILFKESRLFYQVNFEERAKRNV